jgi:hypothetical protein
MKNRLQSALNWMGRKISGKENGSEDTPEMAPSEAPSANIVAFVSTVQTQTQMREPVAAIPEVQGPTVRVRRPDPVTETPRKAVSVADLNAGPEIKVVTRGAKQYGVCPHCEATWNIRERLSHPSFKRHEKGLTCPACDKGVSLPPQTDLRKLS